MMSLINISIQATPSKVLDTSFLWIGKQAVMTIPKIYSEIGEKILILNSFKAKKKNISLFAKGNTSFMVIIHALDTVVVIIDKVQPSPYN